MDIHTRMHSDHGSSYKSEYFYEKNPVMLKAEKIRTQFCSDQGNEAILGGIG